jgi:hypothetical protein
MTTNKNNSHSHCDHDTTKSARAKCRRDAAKAAALIDAQALALIETFDARVGTDRDYITRAAFAFTSFQEGDRLAAAKAVLEYFAPSGDEDHDRSRRANGYTITTSHSEILRIVLRRFS